MQLDEKRAAGSGISKRWRFCTSPAVLRPWTSVVQWPSRRTTPLRT